MRPVSKAYAVLWLSTLLWGVQPMLSKLLVQSITPEMLAGVRFLLISSTLFGLAAWKRKPLLPPLREMPLLALMGVFGIAINNIADFQGLRLSTVINSTILSAATPAITSFLAVIFLREKLQPLQWIGLFLSLFGSFYVITGGSLDVLKKLSFNYGDLYFFFSKFGWAVYSLLGVCVLRKVPTILVVAWSGFWGALISLGYGWATDALRIPHFSARDWFCMGYMVWGGGVCASLCWNAGVKVVGASVASMFSSPILLIGVVCGSLFLHEPFHAYVATGAAAVLLGMVCVTQAERIRTWRDGHQARPS